MAYNSILDTIIPIIAIMAIGFICSALGRFDEKRFSTNVFLTVCAIGIFIIVWKGIIPFYTITFGILAIAAILFSGGRNE